MCKECGCGPHHNVKGEGGFRGRRFLTKAEKAEKLKGYVEELRKELSAVEERIKEVEA
jgi:hypothetical protein